MTIRENLIGLLRPLIYCDGTAVVPGRLHRKWPERQTLRRLLSRLNVDCVLDVGANVGQYGQELRTIGYKGHIVSFEPIPECFKALAGTADRDGDWDCLNVALGNAPGTRQFNVMAASDFSSFLPPGGETEAFYARENAVERVIDVQLATLSDLLPSMRWSRYFLKMDTQGFDFEVFRGARTVLERICGLQSEVSFRHLYDGVPAWHEVIQEYRESGFRLVAMYPVHGDRHEEALEFNCYFWRPDSGDDQVRRSS